MRVVVATNFQILDDRTSGFWNGFAARLERRGIALFLLTTNGHEALTVPSLVIPYTLAGYAQYGFEAPAPDAFLESQIALEACWQTPENLDRVEIGAARCAAFVRSLLEAADPELVLGWNTLLPQSRILQLACLERGVPFQTIEQGLLPGTLLVDPGGNHLDASLANSFALASAARRSRPRPETVSAYRAWYARTRPSKYRDDADDAFHRLASLAADARRTLLVLAPVAGTGLEPADQKLSRRTLPGIREQDTILGTIASAAGRDTLVIFRDHPINRIIGRAWTLPAGVESGQDASLLAYLEIADHVIAIGGTTAAYECLAARKPVLVVGANMLTGLGAMPASDGSALARDVAAFLATGWADHAEGADRALSFLIEHYLVLTEPELEPLGNDLDDLVEFIAGYASRTVEPGRDRREDLAAWRDTLPMEHA